MQGAPKKCIRFAHYWLPIKNRTNRTNSVHFPVYINFMQKLPQITWMNFFHLQIMSEFQRSCSCQKLKANSRTNGFVIFDLL